MFEALNDPEWSKNTTRQGNAMIFLNRPILHVMCEIITISSCRITLVDLLMRSSHFHSYLVLASSSDALAPASFSPSSEESPSSRFIIRIHNKMWQIWNIECSWDIVMTLQLDLVNIVIDFLQNTKRTVNPWLELTKALVRKSLLPPQKNMIHIHNDDFTPHLILIPLTNGKLNQTTLTELNNDVVLSK